MISMSPSNSILRRLVSQSCRRFCRGVGGGGASSKLVGRPSLMLPPSFAAVEEEGGISITKMEYNFYHPLKKNKNSPLLKDMVKDEEILRFYNRGGKEEVALMQDKDTNWVGSSHGWLVLFDKKNRSMSLINPVSGRSIPLPPFPFRNSQDPPVKKVILSHSPDDENCRALTIHGQYDRAAFCSPGRSKEWAPLGRCSYHEFMYSASRKAFVSAKRVTPYWMFPTDELEFWDVESKMEAPVKTVRAPRVVFSDPGWFWQTYLVSEEESGRLFMVRRYHLSNKKNSYEYYRNKNKVEYNVYSIESYVGGEDVQLCESLDDLVMFIGMNHSFAVKASRFPEYRPNCIYFSGGWNWKNGSQNKPFADIYDYKSKDYSPLFYSFSGHDFPFDHKLPWFTLTHDKDCTRLDK